MGYFALLQDRPGLSGTVAPKELAVASINLTNLGRFVSSMSWRRTLCCRPLSSNPVSLSKPLLSSTISRTGNCEYVGRKRTGRGGI